MSPLRKSPYQITLLYNRDIQVCLFTDTFFYKSLHAKINNKQLKIDEANKYHMLNGTKRVVDWL